MDIEKRRKWRREYQKKYTINNKELVRAIYRRSERKNRQKRTAVRRNRIFKYKLLAGGKCQICGYNKNLAALTFHHQENKDILMCRIFDHNHNNIIKEMKKCKLICFNCHQELHNPHWDYKLWSA